MLLKSLFDRGGSFFGLIFLSLVLLVVALLIRIKMPGGPVIFKQKRVGQHGKLFTMYKFRSMIVNDQSDTAWSTNEDPRKTKFGAFIRKYSIDELPQLLNIFKGDMSVVGPRPERPEIAKEYEESIPEFAYRLKVKAGLTGYAQIYGKYNTTAYDKLKLDLMYIESYSILEDLKLILATFKIVFTKESTEGLEEGQTISLNAKEEEKKDV